MRPHSTSAKVVLEFQREYTLRFPCGSAQGSTYRRMNLFVKSSYNETRLRRLSGLCSLDSAYSCVRSFLGWCQRRQARQPQRFFRETSVVLQTALFGWRPSFASRMTAQQRTSIDPKHVLQVYIHGIFPITLMLGKAGRECCA